LGRAGPTVVVTVTSVPDVGDPAVQQLLDRGGPITDIELAAVGHEDPWVRRRCLDFLDHRAADTSTPIFLQALGDPVAIVREVALHGLACERCRTGQICVPEVVARVINVLETDPDADVRYKTLPILRALIGRDHRALDAIQSAAEADPDRLVREGARLALEVGLLPNRHDLARRQRRRSRRVRLMQ
jgi:hypothetical protein